MERAPPGRRPHRPRDRPALTAIGEIEEAFVCHWALLGQWPGARLHDADGVLRFETPIPKIPYNGVIRTQIEDGVDEAIARVVAAYRDTGADFYWVVFPSSRPGDLSVRLEHAGLWLAERAIGMSLDLDRWAPKQARESDIEYAEAVDERGLRAYEDVTLFYWELDERYREHVERLNRTWWGRNARGRRWVAYLEGKPIGKAYLSLAGPPGVASIYGMCVRPEARGRGVASRLTQIVLEQAQALGCQRAVLHSTEMAVGVYRRVGFEEQYEIHFYATAPIWSGME